MLRLSILAGIGVALVPGGAAFAQMTLQGGQPGGGQGLEQLAPISPASPKFDPHTLEPFTPNLPEAPEGSAQAGIPQQPPPIYRPTPPAAARVSPK